MTRSTSLPSSSLDLIFTSTFHTSSCPVSSFCQDNHHYQHDIDIARSCAVLACLILVELPIASYSSQVGYGE